MNVERTETGEVIAQGEEDNVDKDPGYSHRLDRDLDMVYDTYLSQTKKKSAKSGTKMATRLLQGKKDSDDEFSSEEDVYSDDDDDGFRSAPMNPEEHEQNKAMKKEERIGSDRNKFIGLYST